MCTERAVALGERLRAGQLEDVALSRRMVLELNEADESVLREEAKQRGAGVLVGRGDERNFREHAARRGVTDARARVGYGGGAVTTLRREGKPYSKHIIE